jgi:hypothetical protein
VRIQYCKKKKTLRSAAGSLHGGFHLHRFALQHKVYCEWMSKYVTSNNHTVQYLLTFTFSSCVYQNVHIATDSKKNNFQFLTAASMKMSVFHDVAPWRPEKVYWHFRGNCYPHCEFSWLFSVRLGKYRNQKLNQATTTSFHILSNSLVILSSDAGTDSVVK